MKKNQPFDFVVYLQRPEYKKYDLISILLILLAVIILSFFAFYENLKSLQYFIIILLLAYQVLANRRLVKEEETASYQVAFYTIAVSFLLLPAEGTMHYLLALFYIAAAIFERQVKFQEEIGFGRAGITFNSFPKRHFSWDEIQNAVLKEGILTLDFKNNKIYQKEIDLDIAPFLEAEFNDFCRSCVNTRSTGVSAN